MSSVCACNEDGATSSQIQIRKKVSRIATKEQGQRHRQNEKVHVQGRLGRIPTDGPTAVEARAGNTRDAARRTLPVAKGKQLFFIIFPSFIH